MVATARSAGALLGLVPLLLCADGAARADGAPCRARASIEPATAWVGEQVLHAIRVEWRDDVARVEWETPPTFPDHRAERLALGSVSTRTDADGRSWSTRDERRALFAARGGTLATSGATLLCVMRGDTGAPEKALRVPVRALRVRAKRAPAAAPPGFRGVVGEVAVRRHVAPARIRVGESARLTVTVSGAANVWRAETAPDVAPGDGLTSDDVFVVEDRLDVSREEALTARRLVRFDLVPRAPGRITLPAHAVVWLDPASGAFETSTAPPIAVDVLPEDAATPDPAGADAPPRATEREAAPARAGRWVRTVVATAILAALSAAAIFLLFRGRFGRRPLEAGLAEAEAAAARGDARAEAEALERALRAALARRSPALAGLSPPELSFRGQGDEDLLEAAALLEGLERIRYSGRPEAPDRAGVRRWIAAATRANT